jgi:hypothetical protein
MIFTLIIHIDPSAKTIFTEPADPSSGACKCCINARCAPLLAILSTPTSVTELWASCRRESAGSIGRHQRQRAMAAGQIERTANQRWRKQAIACLRESISTCAKS